MSLHLYHYRKKNSSKSEARRRIIKDFLFRYPELSFHQISLQTKAGDQTVKFVWLEMVRNKEADRVLIPEEKLPKKLFYSKRKLTEEEVKWTEEKLKSNHRLSSVSYALKVNKKYVLNQLISK